MNNYSAKLHEKEKEYTLAANTELKTKVPEELYVDLTRTEIRVDGWISDGQVLRDIADAYDNLKKRLRHLYR